MFTKDELLTLSQGIIFAIRNNNEAKTLVSSMEAYEALEKDGKMLVELNNKVLSIVAEMELMD